MFNAGTFVYLNLTLGACVLYGRYVEETGMAYLTPFAEQYDVKYGPGGVLEG